jgi:hypothetical protein
MEARIAGKRGRESGRTGALTESAREEFMVDVKAYTTGYLSGGNAAKYWKEEDEVPDPVFAGHENATFQKGWWDGFNKLEYDPGGQGLFSHPLDRNKEREEELERDREQEREELEWQDRALESEGD